MNLIGPAVQNPLLAAVHVTGLPSHQGAYLYISPPETVTLLEFLYVVQSAAGSVLVTTQ